MLFSEVDAGNGDSVVRNVTVDGVNLPEKNC
jgi:hypothetical protein